MEERLRFVARLLDGEAMTEVCRDFGISRKTGYKIFDRYNGSLSDLRVLAERESAEIVKKRPKREEFLKWVPRLHTR